MITTLELDDCLPPLTSTDGYKYAEPGHLFARIQFKEKLSLESQAGRLILQNTNLVWLSPTSLNSSEERKKVYETKLEYREADNIDVELSEQCVLDLQLRQGQTLEVEVQIQLNRIHLCELHEAVDEIEIPDLVCPEEFPPLDVQISTESR
ncbi:HELZ-like protein [Mya arenaria]|uniref:HELZ-like protein n=4 Tax=Mya arenaria TaxID=6604 RepID=A0ABY7G7L8_MYAAR|nr:HELZ-like protein [Mya arenaria]